MASGGPPETRRFAVPLGISLLGIVVLGTALVISTFVLKWPFDLSVQAEESLRGEREKFGQGRGTSNDLLLAEQALLRSRTELAAAVADSQIALAALKLAVGEDPVSATAAPSVTGSGGG